jgi:tripartite-type tricarboxylate transporter receptor subunit TctC
MAFPTILRLLASVLAVLAAPAAAPAQDFPSRPIRLIVQTQPGGLIDQLARTFGQKLAENTGAVAVVENRTGGGGLIAAEHVLNSPADGYTVYVASHGSQAIHPHLTKLSFDPVKAFAPVIYLATTPTLLVVHPSVPAKSLGDDRRQGQSGQVHLASQGNGCPATSSASSPPARRGRPRHVPYMAGAALACRSPSRRCSTPSRSRRAGEERQVARARVARCAGQVAAGVPTMAEAGPRRCRGPWFGLVVAAAPRPVIDWLNREATASPPGRAERYAAGHAAARFPEASPPHRHGNQRWGSGPPRQDFAETEVSL